jgi:hypothetical protein
MNKESSMTDGDKQHEVWLSRPEAQAFDYDRLTGSQREAVGKILEILDDAQKKLINKSDKDPSDDFPGFIPVPEKNSNRALLLSGGRGSGKTSVLYSLIKFLVDSGGKCRDWKEFNKELDELRNDYKKLEKDFTNFKEDNYKSWSSFIKSFNSMIKSNSFNEIKPEDFFKEKKPIDEKKFKELNNNIDKKIEERNKKENFFGKCKDVNKKFIWLQPLEMETLPPSTNLLAAILNRIDEAVYRFRGKHPKPHQRPSSYSPYHLNQEEHDIMLEFAELQKDVALAWDGNIEKRAANVDPDVYAVEVLRAEQKRLRLNARIEKCLDDLHKLFIKPCTGDTQHLFVLPIDDFDLNPHRCLELLRLIRILNVPRLFTIILGDLWLIRSFMNFKYFQSITTSGPNQESVLANLRYDECELAHNLSGGANRKLFPMTSVIFLERMTIDEVYQFNLTADPKKNFEKYLKDIKGININTAYFKEEKDKTYHFGNLEIQKQHDLFDQKVDKLIEGNESKSKQKYFYIRNKLYKLYPRLVQDIWLRMHIDNVEKKINEEYYLTHANRIYGARIRQERGLTTGSSIFLNGILRKNFQEKFQLDISALDLVYTYGQPLIFQQDKAFINILHPGNWDVKLTHLLKSGGTEEVILNQPTAAALIFMHDLLAFSDPTRIIGKNLILKNGTPLWAYTQWPLGSDACPIKVPWHFPPWQTVFECDLLRRCWIEVWEWSREIAKEAKDAIFIKILVYLWLRIITNILSKPKNSRKIHLRKDSIKIKNEDNYHKNSLKLYNKKLNRQASWEELLSDCQAWEELLSDIRNLHDYKKNQTKKREQIIRGWFAAIGCLLAPETNIPKDIREFFAEYNYIKKIIIETIIAGGIRKLRAQSAVLFFDNGALDLLKDLFNPQRKTKVEIESFDNNIRDISVDFINVIGGNYLCPFVEDIVMLSKLNSKKKKEFEEKLVSLI